MENTTSCKHEDCPNAATEVLISRPGELMVLDGEATAHFVCGQDGHTASNLRESILRYDLGAKFWTFHAQGPISEGQVFASLPTGSGQ